LTDLADVAAIVWPAVPGVVWLVRHRRKPPPPPPAVVIVVLAQRDGHRDESQHQWSAARRAIQCRWRSPRHRRTPPVPEHHIGEIIDSLSAERFGHPDALAADLAELTARIASLDELIAERFDRFERLGGISPS
jgi:hypothetical protein